VERKARKRFGLMMSAFNRTIVYRHYISLAKLSRGQCRGSGMGGSRKRSWKVFWITLWLGGPLGPAGRGFGSGFSGASRTHPPSGVSRGSGNWVRFLFMGYPLDSGSPYRLCRLH